MCRGGWGAMSRGSGGGNVCECVCVRARLGYRVKLIGGQKVSHTQTQRHIIPVVAVKPGQAPAGLLPFVMSLKACIRKSEKVGGNGEVHGCTRARVCASVSARCIRHVCAYVHVRLGIIGIHKPDAPA